MKLENCESLKCFGKVSQLYVAFTFLVQFFFLKFENTNDLIHSCVFPLSASLNFVSENCNVNTG